MVDATTDHGRSGGVDGAASSLDLTVRAAASIAEHAVRRGDRVALRVISGDGPKLGFASGRGQLRRLLATLAVVRPSGLAEGYETRLRLEAPEGTMVVLLSPLLGDHVGTLAAALLTGGVPTLVLDTLPPDARPAYVADDDRVLHELAWRMRLLEREQRPHGSHGPRLPGRRLARAGDARRRAQAIGPRCKPAAGEGR